MKTSSRRIGWLVVGTSIALSALGCIQVKKQSIFIKTDEKNESMSILLMHEGFYAEFSSNGDRADALTNANQRLAKYATDTETIGLFRGFFDQLELKPQPNDDQSSAQIKRKLTGLIETTRGKFLLNRQGELCGYQTITIPRPKALVQVINEWISESLKQNGVDPSKLAPLSPATAQLIQEAAAKGHEWFRFKDGLIVFDVPMTPADAEMVLAKKETDKVIREFFDNTRKVFASFQVSRSDDGLSFVFGTQKGRLVTLVLSPDENPRLSLDRELLDYARDLPDAFDKSQDAEAVIGKFKSNP